MFYFEIISNLENIARLGQRATYLHVDFPGLEYFYHTRLLLSLSSRISLSSVSSEYVFMLFVDTCRGAEHLATDSQAPGLELKRGHALPSCFSSCCRWGCFSQPVYCHLLTQIVLSVDGFAVWSGPNRSAWFWSANLWQEDRERTCK